MNKETQKTKKFDPTKHLTDIKGKQYLEVKWRLVWFRNEHPDWTIQTRVVHWIPDGAVVQAAVRNEQGHVMATAHKMETKQGFADYLEKAETGAIGRSLALLGYGTQFAHDFEEGDRIVDAPVMFDSEPKNVLEFGSTDSWSKESATPAQVKKLSVMMRNVMPETQATMLKDRFGVDQLEELTKRQASDLIGDLVKSDAPQKVEMPRFNRQPQLVM